LLLTMSYDTELKLINFTLEYSLEVRRWPLKILSDVF
jgi:hypothetical protein